jgi:hypothetical protein
METKDQLRFMQYVNKDENGCWKWCGSRAITGYANFFYNGKVYLAHRASLLIWGKVKQLTSGLQVAHSCGNRDCVSPEHLSEKSRSENNGADKRLHGKDLSGTKCHFAKLNWDKVSQIRHRACEGITSKQLSKEYGISRSAISQILQYKTWKLQ